MVSSDVAQSPSYSKCSCFQISKTLLGNIATDYASLMMHDTLLFNQLTLFDLFSLANNQIYCNQFQS